MMYSLAADLVLVMHFLFIAFALGGAALVLRWRWLAALQIPAAAWAALIEFRGWICPLTPLEQTLRRAAGETGYEGGFIEHYLEPVIYPAGLTPEIQTFIGLIVVVLNVALYAWIVIRFVRERKRRAK